MTTTTQTAIKIGDSVGVTLPAKELKRHGIKPGDRVRISFEPESPTLNEVKQAYDRFEAAYGETLKNLADR